MVEKRPSSKYTPEQVDRGLFALAVLGGNAAAAERQLKAQGHRVPKATLQDWKTKHADRFQEIANRHTKRIREVIAQEQVEIAHVAGEAEREAIAKARGQLRDGSIKDASTAARNFSVTKGVSIDKALKQRGEPNVIDEDRHAEDIIASLKRLAPQVFDSEAVEIPPLALPNGNRAH